MKICLKTGSTATALGPSSRSSVGTSRQPSTSWPSSIRSPRRASRPARAHADRAAETPGRPHSRARGGRVMPMRRASLAKEPVGHLHQNARRRRRCSPRTRTRRDHGDTVIVAGRNIAVVHKKIVDNILEPPQGLVVVRGDRLLAQIPAGHDERPSGLPQEKVVQWGIGEHRTPQIFKVRGYCRRHRRIGFPLQEYDGADGEWSSLSSSLFT